MGDLFSIMTIEILTAICAVFLLFILMRHVGRKYTDKIYLDLITDDRAILVVNKNNKIAYYTKCFNHVFPDVYRYKNFKKFLNNHNELMGLKIVILNIW